MSVAEATMDVERRGSARVVVNMAAKISQHGQTLDCTIENLSLTGAKLQLSLVVDPDEPLILTIPNVGTFRGTVIWRYNGKLGMAFSRRADDLAPLLEKHAGEEEPECEA